MGVASSAPVPEDMYSTLVRVQSSTPAATGGIFGGALETKEQKEHKSMVDDLVAYRESEAAKAKEQLVRKIARALQNQKLLQSVDVDGASLEELTEAIKKSVPSNVTARASFGENAEKHKQACAVIASALNAQFTPGAPPDRQLIDVSGKPSYICSRVSDIVHSMTCGIETEFLQVQVGVRKALQDLAALAEYSRVMHAEAARRLAEGATAEARREAEPYLEAFSRLENEVAIARKSLENYMKVAVGPPSEELEFAMTAEKDLYVRLMGQRLTPGTSEFADAIVAALSNLGSLAGVAARAQRALKTVSASMADYANAVSWSRFAALLDERTEGARSADEMVAVAKAKEILKQQFPRREEIAKAAHGETLAARAHGGAPGDALSEMDVRVRARRMERNLILKQYLERSRHAYDDLLAAVGAVGPKLGKTIPVGEGMDALRDALERLNGQSVPRLDLALIGFYTSADARSRRETFLAQLADVVRAVDALTAAEAYSAHVATLKPIRDAIVKLIRVIDDHSKVVSEKFAVGGALAVAHVDSEGRVQHVAHVDSEGNVQNVQHQLVDAEVDAEGGAEGGADDEVDLADLRLAEQMRSSLDLKSAINAFVYYLYFAKVRENMKGAAKDLEAAGARYEDVVGDSIAGRKQALEAERKEILDPAKPADHNHIGPQPAGPATDDAVKRWTAAKAAVEEEYATKTQFYEVLEAMDIYMRHFSKGITADPEAVLNIKSDLNGIDMIAKWYAEETGDRLAEFFDLSRAHGEDDPAAVAKIADEGGHYYERVGKTLAGGGHVGSTAPVWATQAAAMRAKAGEVLENFQALKNLVNTFVRLGASFGGVELRSAVFMTPREMYTRLVRYLKVSAVSTRGSGAGMAALSTPVPFGAQPTQQALLCYPTPASVGAADARVSNWAVENRYFHFIIKCIAAKILVVIGTYDLFERPEPVYELLPTRMYLGGAPGAPEVHPEAAELYFRLPRLAEFYYGLFKFDSTKDTQLAMLPEMEGPFSGLIMQVFVRSRAVAETGDYSNSESEAIIAAVNQVYEAYRRIHGDNASRKALEDFVSEVNRRYGLVKKSDWEQMQKMLDETRLSSTVAEGSPTNFAILPDEEDMYPSSSKRLAPSDRFLRPGEARSPAVAWSPGKYKIDDAATPLHDIFVEFRQRLDSLLGASDPERRRDYGRASYRSLITQARREMEKTPDPSKRLETAHRLIQGSELVTGTDQGRALMFHETVVVGLGALMGIYRQLDSFRRRVKEMDIADMIDKIDPAAAVASIYPNMNIGPEYRRDVANATELRDVFSPPLVDDTQVYTVGDMINALSAAVGAATPEEVAKIKSALSRIVIDRPKLMRSLLLTLFELTSDFDGMVTVRFPGTASSKLHLDFSKLREVVESLMEDMRRFINMFRSSMSPELIKEIETDSAKEGSLAWLEKNLMDEMMKGYQRASGEAYTQAGTPPTIELIGRKLNDTFVELTRRHPVALQYVAPIGAGAAYRELPAADEEALYDQYGNILSGLLFWDAAVANSGVVDNAGAPTVSVALNAAGFTQLQALIVGPRPLNAAPGAANAELVTNAHLLPLYSSERIVNTRSGRSIMLSFNQVMHMYLSQFYDASSGKIYLGLIDGFANGSFSQSVMVDGYAHPDVYGYAAAPAAGDNFLIRGDPTGRSVLHKSIATILQRLVKDMTNQGVSLHLVSTLSEIPSYMKESYRATLPTFQKMFELLGKQAELIKEVVQRGSIHCGRTNTNRRGTPNDLIPGGAAITFPGGQKSGITLHPLGGVDANMHTTVSARLMDVIDGLTRGCYTMSTITQEVVRQLGDQPQFLQTSEMSIQDYQARYQKLPLMPLSLAYYALRATSDELGAVQAVGSPEFRFVYGVRGLLAPTATLAIPGAKAILETYNAGVAARDKIEVAKYEEFAGRLVRVLRYLSDTRTARAELVDSAGTFANGLNFTAAAAGVAPPYAMRPNIRLTQVLEVVDSSYQEERIADVTRGLATAGAGTALRGGRAAERVRNIIDMNIIPINVHALMRSMALSEVYNASYTMEQLVCLFFGRTREKVIKVDTGVNIAAGDAPKSTLDFFLKLLLEPCSPVNFEQYGMETSVNGVSAWVQRMMRGDSNIGLGRPKMLSDQVFNKALFGSLYPLKADHDEVGPSGAISRGRDNWGTPAAAGIPPNLNTLNTIKDTLVGVRNILTPVPGILTFLNYSNAITGTFNDLDTMVQTLDGNLGGTTDLTTFNAARAGLAAGAATNGFAILNPSSVLDRSVLAAIALRDKARGLINTISSGAAPAASFLNNGALVAANDQKLLNLLVSADIPVVRKVGVNTPLYSWAQVKTALGALTVDQIYAELAKVPDTAANIIAAAAAAGAGTRPYQFTGENQGVDFRVIIYMMNNKVDLNAFDNNPFASGKDDFVNILKDETYKYIKGTVYPVVSTELGELFKASYELVKMNSNGLTPLSYDEYRSSGYTFANAPGAAHAAARSASSVLTYIESIPEDQKETASRWEVIKEVGVGRNKETLMRVGYDRWNTSFVRMLTFIVNTFRIVRQQVSDVLTVQHTVIQRTNSLVDRSTTEYGIAPQGADETAGDRRYFSERSMLA